MAGFQVTLHGRFWVFPEVPYTRAVAQPEAPSNSTIQKDISRMKLLLTFLPYFGLVLTTFSAIWGLTHELYTKDANNRRQLTSAGRYSIAFAVLGLLISLNTAILKSIIDKQDKAAAIATAESEKLANQQREETRDRKAVEEARITQDKIDSDAQSRQLDELAQKQRDLALSQQQIQGFNKAEAGNRKRAVAELQRTNTLLFNVNRGQYPITKDLKITPFIRISTEHPILNPYAQQIKRAAELYEKYRNSGNRSELNSDGDLVLREDSPVLSV